MTKPDIEKGITTAHPTAANDEPVSVSAATTTAATEEETETSGEPGGDDRDVVDEAVSTTVHNAAAGEGAAATGEIGGFPTLRQSNLVVPGGISAPTVDCTSPTASHSEDARTGETPEEDPSIPHIPDAFLVEDREEVQEPVEVYLGTPVQPPTPWWKQQRTKIFTGVVFVLVVVLTAVSLSWSRSSSEPAVDPLVAVFEEASDFPSQSAGPSEAPSVTGSPTDGPSYIPTTPPSYRPSVIPSSAPSSCSETIMSNKHKIDLPLDDPQDIQIAVDGLDMMTVAREGGAGGPVFVTFHALINMIWQRVETFQVDDLLGRYSVDSVVVGNGMAFVGFPEASGSAEGMVNVYNKNPQTGDWDEVEDAFVHDTNTTHVWFGNTVEIAGDLACVGSWNNAYLFHRYGNNWVQFDEVIGHGCNIEENTIFTYHDVHGEVSVFKYDKDFDGIIRIQDPIATGRLTSAVLGKDHFVYWAPKERNAVVYHHDGDNQTFSLLQQLNITGPVINRGLALDNDIMVIGGINKTHIFSDQDGFWEETFTLSQSYDYYALSSRNLLAATWNEVHYFDIARCAQVPSLPTAPTASLVSP
mmetsp:Transcript_9958/g.24359  ORF Transcript_9958/g.24359 Transcript_9958/m.24359 type:complete len:584 (-) Transcript_9958:126-1877(-)